MLGDLLEHVQQRVALGGEFQLVRALLAGGSRARGGTGESAAAASARNGSCGLLRGGDQGGDRAGGAELRGTVALDGSRPATTWPPQNSMTPRQCRKIA